MKQNLKYHGTLQTGGGCMNHYFSVNGEGLMLACDMAFVFPATDMGLWMDGDNELEAPIMEPMDNLVDGTQIYTFKGWLITLEGSELVILDKDGGLAARFRINYCTGHNISHPITIEEPPK